MAGKKRRKSVTAIIFAVLLLVIAAMAALYFFLGNRLLVPGEYQRIIDISGECEKAVTEYFLTAGYDSEAISDEVKEQLAGITLSVKLEITADGQWKEKPDDEAYAQAYETAGAALKQAVKELLEKSVNSNDIATDKSVEELVKDATGMDIDSYLVKYAPQPIETYENYCERFCSEGTCEIGRDKITVTTYDDIKEFDVFKWGRKVIIASPDQMTMYVKISKDEE